MGRRTVSLERLKQFVSIISQRYQWQVKALAWVPPLARCQSSLFSLQAFLWKWGVCAPKSTKEEPEPWRVQEGAQSSSASEVSAFTALSSPVPESNHHPPTVPRDKAEPAGRRKPLIFPALLSKYAITIILWTFTAPFHTRGWVLHKHSFPRPRTTHLRKPFFFHCTTFSGQTSRRAQHPFCLHWRNYSLCGSALDTCGQHQ